MVWSLSELLPHVLLVSVFCFSRMILVLILIFTRILLGPVISLPLGDGFDFFKSRIFSLWMNLLGPVI